MGRRAQGPEPDRGPDRGPETREAAQVMRGPLCGESRDQAFTLSFSALAMVTLTTLSAGFVIISWVCGLRT